MYLVCTIARFEPCAVDELLRPQNLFSVFGVRAQRVGVFGG